MEVLLRLDLLGILTLGKKSKILTNKQKIQGFLQKDKFSVTAGANLNRRSSESSRRKSSRIGTLNFGNFGQKKTNDKELAEASKYWSFFSKEIGVYDIQVQADEDG